MKKLSKERRLWLIAHQKRIERRRNLPRRQNKISRSSHVDILSAPERMCFEDNYEEVAFFFNKFRKKALSFTSRKKFSIDFEPINFISPGAALVLAAELDRWRKTHDIKLKPWKPKKWHPRVKRLFDEMGLFSLLEIKKKDKNLKNSDDYLRFFKFLTGKASDGEIADKLMKSMGPALGAEYNEERLYIAMSEAMTNVVQHAYPENENFKYPILPNQWWTAGSFNRKSKMMTVLFYDQGVGIPATLPKQNFWQDIISVISGKYLLTNQGALILGALEVGRTRSKLAHRGKGLRQCLDFSLRSKDGNIIIMSDCGGYKESPDSEPIIYQYKNPLGGTFIQWRVKLD
ncbi:MAG: hypothetical protein PF482_04425 [Desulfobacteraceae bacterium]|nr:hypothetical protein [Desulfobacteraceae bacterium]